MLRLPTELHAQIASFLHYPPDLGSLSIVSSHWLSVVQPILYRTLILRNSQPSILDTISLLIRDENLAKSVRSLSLITEFFPGDDASNGAQWVNLIESANLENIRRLKIDGVPDMSWDLFRKLFADIMMKTKNLEEMSCIDTDHTAHAVLREGYFEPFANLPHALGKLKFALYFDGTCKFFDSVQPFASITTLEILLDSEHDQVSLDLEKTHFPRLSDFIVHTIADLPIQDSVALMAFLVAHPTILTFSLPGCKHFPGIGSKWGQVLPMLASLSVTPDLFMSLAPIWNRAHKLSYLSIKHGPFGFPPYDRDSTTMLQNLPNESIFRNLKRCCFGVNRDDYDNIFQCLKSAVDIEWWTFFFPLYDSRHGRFSEILPNHLLVFPKIARIDFQESRSSIGSLRLHHFARRIPTLRKINIYRSHRMRLEIIKTFEIQRNTNSEENTGQFSIKEAYRLPSIDGPYIQDRRVISHKSIDWEEDERLDGWSHCAHMD